jgi:hypothetical protein
MDHIDASDVLEVPHRAFPTILDHIYPTEVQKYDTTFNIDGKSNHHGDVFVACHFYDLEFWVDYWSDVEIARALTIRPNVKWRVYWATRTEWLCVRVAAFLGHN